MIEGTTCSAKSYDNASAFGQPVLSVDTSKRIDHLRIGNECLRSLLRNYQVVCQLVVISAVALGNVRYRSEILHRLKVLPEGPIADHGEGLYLVTAHCQHGQELGSIDAHLLASV